MKNVFIKNYKGKILPKKRNSVGWSFYFHENPTFGSSFEDQIQVNLRLTVVLVTFLGPDPGTIALDPTFGSFTLLEPVSLVKVFRLFRLEWMFLVLRVWTQEVDVQRLIY